MKKIPVRSINSAEANPGIYDSFKIRTVTEILAGQDMTQDLHRHNFYFILVLKKAEGTHEIDFAPYPVTGNSIYLMRPGQVHRLALKAGSEGYLMEFGKNLFYTNADKDLLRKTANTVFFNLEAPGVDKILSTLSSIYDEYSNKHEGYQEVIKANLAIFFIELVRQKQNNIEQGDAGNDYARERLQEFLELLEAEISTHKQVAYYANKLNLSQFQLNSITKTLLTKTAAALIDDYILLESKRLLLATDNLVNQIAFYLGYEDVSYFIRFFKKHIGHTPEAFRQNFK